MLTLLHPELLRKVHAFPIGIMALSDPDGGEPFLIVKATKEFLLAAKMNASFKIYVAPASLNGTDTNALVSAFFDDEDEPLTIRTAMHDDEQGRAIYAALLSGTPKVHFFDEHCRELLSYEAELYVPSATKHRLGNMVWLKGDGGQTHSMLVQVGKWFGLRVQQDDEEAITVRLVRTDHPDGLAIQDMRLPLHQHHGSKGYSMTLLEREEPGTFQEEDIIKCLAMCFGQGMIYHAPLRTNDKEEICDVMLVTPDRLLIIQAKDSPSIERISRQKLSRKRATVMKAFKGAVGQVRGAHTYIKSCGDTLRYILKDEERELDTSNKELWALVIVKEIFDDETESYAKILNALMLERSIACVALDYGKLFELCYRLADPEKFFELSEEIVDYTKREKDLPIINFK